MTHFWNDKRQCQDSSHFSLLDQGSSTAHEQATRQPLPCQPTSPPAQCTMHYVFLKTTCAILKRLKFRVEYEILQNTQCALFTFCLYICPPALLTCLPSLSAQSTPQHHVGKKLPAMQIVKIMHLEVYIHSTLNNLDPYFLCTCQGKLFFLSPFSAYLKYLFCILKVPTLTYSAPSKCCY